VRRLARLVLCLAAVALAAGAAELALTLWFGGGGDVWEIVPEADSPFVFRPAAACDGGTQPGSPTQAAASGDDASTAARPKRVLSYGDSIAAGFGVGASRAYPVLLGARLARPDGAPTVEIVPLMHGHSPSIYAQHLRYDVPDLLPDAVLVEVELVNDLADEAHVRNAAPAGDGLPARVERARYLVGWDGRLLAPLAWRGTWLERTKLFALLSHAWGRLRSRWQPNPLFAGDSPETYYARAFDRHRLTRAELDAASIRLFDVLGAMRDMLEARGVAMAVVVMPSRHAFETGALRAHGRSMVERARSELALRGIRYVSLLDQIEAAGGDALYLDFCHPTAQGHVAIANALADAVGEGLLGPALARP